MSTRKPKAAIATPNQNEYTFCSLMKWSKCMHEKLGWMALSVSYGHQIKAKAYLESIDHLLDGLKAKMNTIHSEDKKTDLRITHEHVTLLKANAKKLIKL
jgi:hypothetical protein